MLRFLLLSLWLTSLALLASAIPAQAEIGGNVTLAVLAVEDTRIRVGVADTLSPRTARYQVLRVDGGQTTHVASGEFQTPIPQPGAWLPGLDSKTLYDISVTVGTGPSAEGVAVQTHTTWLGIPGQTVKQAQPLIAQEIDGFLTSLGASAEARGATYRAALRQDLTAAFVGIREEAQARRRADLERQLRGLPEL